MYASAEAVRFAGTKDQQLESRVLNYLHARGVPGLESLQVEADHGTLVISGTLPSMTAKKLCVQCCQRVAGVIQLIDRTELAGDETSLRTGSTPSRDRDAAHVAG